MDFLDYFCGVILEVIFFDFLRSLRRWKVFGFF